MGDWVVKLALAVGVVIAILLLIVVLKNKMRNNKRFERGLKMVPMMIHLPPSTDDIRQSGRDERDIINESIGQAQMMYSIIASTFEKSWKNNMYGQRHFSFEIMAKNGLIHYYVFAPAVLTETIKQAIQTSYPTARVEEKMEENIFSETGGANGVAGAELTLKNDYSLSIGTYEQTKYDASRGILNALSALNKNDGACIQILFRPAQNNWTEQSTTEIESIKIGKETKKTGGATIADFVLDLLKAPFEPPKVHEKTEETVTTITRVQQEKMDNIAEKMRYPAFETLIRIVVSATNKAVAEAEVGSIAAAFAQFDAPMANGFKINPIRDTKKLVVDYSFRFFPVNVNTNILNSVELASIFHLPEQKSIPSSQVERQLIRQVDGPAKLATQGVLLGVNEFRGEKKSIYLDDDNRRRHMYILGQTGMGKSVFLENVAYQDIIAGRGLAFIDPHGDAVEALLKRIPKERIDDVIYFDPADIEHPIGMNMFEFSSDDQKDFIVQEGISMLMSLFDPNNQGFFGPRGQHMFRNAALLLMADPAGATFIDIPQCFTDPEFVKAKLRYVTDKAVYDYWTREFPASQKSNDAGEVITWFASKWGPFLSNTIMRNTLGQIKSGFNIRDIMDNKKIFLVNLSKGRLGDINANLLGMILVMKFQQTAMSRQNIPEEQRQDFCLYVDEFQNFATDSFESILSEARKYRLNLIVANQFMTQLTDKIREAILGNVGTIICGRVGITDADLMVKAFAPTFSAEDLTKTPNHAAICKVMMFGMPSIPFTMSLLPPMGQADEAVMVALKNYSATRFGRTRMEVEREINQRWTANAGTGGESGTGKISGENKNFIDDWVKNHQN